MNAQIARKVDPSQTVTQTAGRPGRSELDRPHPSARDQLLAAFSKIGSGSDEKTAHVRTTAWYRSSGTGWTRGLD
jgi:hypothetical protein